MLQNKFEMPLDLAIKPSKIFYSYLIIIVLLAAISILISSSLLLSLRLLLFFLLLFMTALIVIKQKSNQVTCLFLNKDDEWELQVNNKQRYKVELKGECIVTYFLIWLNFSSRNIWGKEKIHHILLLPDSADKDLLRQLRVRLRFLKSESPTVKDIGEM